MKRWLFPAAALLAALSLFFGIVPLLMDLRHTGVWALLALGGLLLLWMALSRRERAPRLRRGVGLLVAAALAGGCALSVPMVGQAFFSGPEQPPAVILVLGARVREGEPSRLLANRLDTALELLNAWPEALCVLSGGQGADESSPEAVVMASYLTERGIDPDRLLLEDRSHDTQENIRNSAALLERRGLPHQVVLVTDGFHQLRASVLARREGLTVSSVSSPTPWTIFPSYWVREFFGLCALAVGLS